MGKIRQIHTSISCAFGSLLVGLLAVWPSYTLNLFKDSHTPFLTAPMTDVEGSLLGSLPLLGAMVGTALTDVVIGKFGRQKGGMLTTLPFVTIIATDEQSVHLMANDFVAQGHLHLSWIKNQNGECVVPEYAMECLVSQ